MGEPAATARPPLGRSTGELLPLLLPKPGVAVVAEAGRGLDAELRFEVVLGKGRRSSSISLGETPERGSSWRWAALLALASAAACSRDAASSMRRSWSGVACVQSIVETDVFITHRMWSGSRS